MKYELGTTDTPPRNEVLVQGPDASLTEEIEYRILLDVWYDRKVLEIILDRLRVPR